MMCATMQPTSNAVMLSSLARGDLWAAVVLVAAPPALMCATVIVLVLAVERKRRVEAIKALPPVVDALARQVGSVRGRHARAADAPQGEAGIGRAS